MDCWAEYRHNRFCKRHDDVHDRLKDGRQLLQKICENGEKFINYGGKRFKQPDSGVFQAVHQLFEFGTGGIGDLFKRLSDNIAFRGHCSQIVREDTRGFPGNRQRSSSGFHTGEHIQQGLAVFLRIVAHHVQNLVQRHALLHHLLERHSGIFAVLRRRFQIL